MTLWILNTGGTLKRASWKVGKVSAPAKLRNSFCFQNINTVML